MITWKCTVCWAKQSSEARPHLIDRLCKKCMVAHRQKILMIYASNQRSERYQAARDRLREAQKALAEEAQ